MSTARKSGRVPSSKGVLATTLDELMSVSTWLSTLLQVGALSFQADEMIAGEAVRVLGVAPRTGRLLGTGAVLMVTKAGAEAVVRAI